MVLAAKLQPSRICKLIRNLKKEIMKTLFTTTLLIWTLCLNAQLIIDDFSTGELTSRSFSATDSEFAQSGDNIAGKKRTLLLHISRSEDNQEVQVAIKKNKLVASFGYNARGVLKVNYGSTAASNPKPLNLNVSPYKNLIVEFEGMNSQSGFHVTLSTHRDRAFWRDNIKERKGNYILTIPLVEFKKVGKNFTFKDIDTIKFQFNSNLITGHNFAIKKILFK